MALNMKSFTALKWHYQAGIVLAICLAGLGVLWYYYISPMDDQIVEKKAQLSLLDAEVAKGMKLKADYARFEADSIELEKTLAELKLVLPREKETDQIIKAIQREAITSSVRIMQIFLRPSIDREVFTEWPWTLEVVGTYNSITSFFDRIRKLPRIVNVSNLKVASRSTEGELAFTASVSATFTATTFIYKDEPIATTAPPPKPAK